MPSESSKLGLAIQFYFEGDTPNVACCNTASKQKDYNIKNLLAQNLEGELIIAQLVFF
jgi:hypothetical protein